MRSNVALPPLSSGGVSGYCSEGAQKKVWSMQVPSPGGEWRAIAETFVWTGPGTNDGETTVRIERGTGRDLYSSEVLAVGDAGQSLGLSMKWLSPTHLLIVIKEDPGKLQEQVVKTSGIDISLKYDNRGGRH